MDVLLKKSIRVSALLGFAIIILSSSQFAFAQNEVEITFKDNLIAFQKQANNLEDRLKNIISIIDEKNRNNDISNEIKLISDELTVLKIFLESTLNDTDPKIILSDKESLKILIETHEINTDLQISIEQGLEKINSESKSFVYFHIINETNQLNQKQIINFISKVYGSNLKPILQPHITKIKLVQYLGSTDLPFADFGIRNIGKVPTENLDIFFTKLVNTAEIRYVGNTNAHIFDGLKLRGPPNEILNDESETFKYYLTEDFKEEGTYEGQIKISGDNFDTLSLDVEIEAKVNPWYLLFTTFVGIGTSLGLGYIVSYYGKKKLLDDSFKNEPKVFKSLNDQIREWNTLSNSINCVTWKNLLDLAISKTESIKEYMATNILTKDHEEVKWFKTISPSLFIANLTGGNYRNIHITIKFEKPERNPDFKEKQYKTIRKDLKNLKKWVYMGGTVVISIPTAIFVADTFVGFAPINFAIAFGTGFAIHKIQDIRSLLSKKE